MPIRRIFLLLSISTLVFADQADRIVEEEMQKQHIPGAAVAVLRDGRPIKLRGYGVANLEHNVPATAESVFKVGSIGKQFVAAGILLLVKDGKLSLDDSITKYLEDAPAYWQPVNFRRLLSHTGGIVRNGPIFDHLKVAPVIDVVRSAYPSPLQFPVGEKWQYCNVCYFAAAEVITRLSGKPWTDFLQERLFQPLGMQATRPTSFSDVVPHRAGGYEWRDGAWHNVDIMLPVSPSGGQLSTVIDLAKWDAALYTDNPLPAALKAEMWKPTPLNSGRDYGYGLGWELGNFRGHKYVRHTGSLTGFQGHLVRFVDDKLSIIVFANEARSRAAAIANRLAEHYLDLPPEAKKAAQ
jgi:CubicO group peptidase (beta-lactamase class C family)